MSCSRIHVTRPIIEFLPDRTLESVRRSLLPTMLLLLLAACIQRPDEAENAFDGDPADWPAEPSPVRTPPTSSERSARVWFEPATLENCTPPVSAVTTINWDASASGVGEVDVRLVGSDGIETLFATGKPVGSEQSGDWMFPNSIVVLRDNATGVELARGIVGSRPCGH
jgi:hypothetical protein